MHESSIIIRYLFEKASSFLRHTTLWELMLSKDITIPGTRTNGGGVSMSSNGVPVTALCKVLNIAKMILGLSVPYLMLALALNKKQPKLITNSVDILR